MVFNHDSRKKNVLKASAAALAGSILGIGIQFGYRVVFLHILTYQYLGMEGLFSNILSLLGLADLGFTNAVIYRLYAPISREDTAQVGRLMGFFRRAYHRIALFIFVLGCLLCPFLKLLIRDEGEIPQGVKLYPVYLLMLLQTVSTYLFSCRFSLLSADQKQHLTSLVNSTVTVLRYSIQVGLLIATKSYILTLSVGILVTLLCNWLAGKWAERQYPQIYRCQSSLSGEERKPIYRDMSAILLHSVGGAVVNSTDSILLSRFVGLTVAGIYANYQLVLSGLNAFIRPILGGLLPSFGNAHATLEPSQRYRIYKRMLFFNFWLAGLTCCCLYHLVDSFILLWVRQALFLDSFTVALLCLLYYLQTVRIVSSLYITSCGLLRRDRVRPLIEAVLNLVISVVCLRTIGTAGIFAGTIASNLATVFWREPYLLYRYAFQQRLREYWRLYAVSLLITASAVWLSGQLKTLLFETQVTALSWLLCAVMCGLVFLTLHALVFFRSEEYRYFAGLLRQRLFPRL